MQREIKFRVWDTTKKEMVQVKQIIIPDGNDENELQELAVSHLKYGTNPSHWLITSSIMQYTGHKDKNGKEIYEGDIVTQGEGKTGFPPYDAGQPRVIEFCNGCWCFDDGDWIKFGYWIASNEGRNQLKQIEVIGNIYSNPELVEEKWQKY